MWPSGTRSDRCRRAGLTAARPDGAEGWGAALGVAALSTALAYVTSLPILATAGATNFLLVKFLIPVSAILPGSPVLGERLDVRHCLGMALIGRGLAAIDGRLVKIIGRRRPAS